MRTPSFALPLLLLIGCGNAGSPAAPACENDAAVADTSPSDTTTAEVASDTPAPELARETLTWSVEFPTGGKLAEIPTVTFRGALGLVPAQSEVVEATGAVLSRTVTPFEGFGGDTSDATALSTWFGRIVAWTPCDTCDAGRDWVKASVDLARPAVVSALTKDGQWLARWSLNEAWPADYSGGKRKDGRFEVTSLNLAGVPTTYELNPANPWLAKVLKSAGLSPAKLPDATLGFGKAPTFPTAALTRPFLGVTGLCDGMSMFATSTPLYAEHGSSGVNPLFESTAPEVLRPTVEVRDGDKVLLRGVGLTQQVEIVEYKNGDNPITHKRPGRAKFKNLVLRRADVVDPSVLTWLDGNFFGKVERKSGSIVYLDREGNEVMRSTMTNATPAPQAVVPSRLGPTDWAVPEVAGRWQPKGIGHAVVIKMIAESIDPK